MISKNMFRFTLSSNKIEPHFVKSIKRPNFTKRDFDSNLLCSEVEFVLYDTAVFDDTKKIYSFIDDPDNLCLKFLKDDEQVYESWHFNDLTIKSVEFNDLSYTNNLPDEIKIIVKIDQLEIYGLDKNSKMELLSTFSSH